MTIISPRQPTATDIELWVKKLQEILQAQHREAYPNLEPPKYRAHRMRKYTKVICYSTGSSHVYAFIENATGDILKPASWRAPAKHARGNIFNESPFFGCGMHGVAYLR